MLCSEDEKFSGVQDNNHVLYTRNVELGMKYKVEEMYIPQKVIRIEYKIC